MVVVDGLGLALLALKRDEWDLESRNAIASRS